MKISIDVVGATVGPCVQDIDARWLMAYAAALGGAAPEYFDTTRADGVVAHPLFPVCYEWPVASMLRDKTLTAEISRRSVHATHDMRLHRRPRTGDRLSTTATIVAVEPRRPGAYVLTRFETVDADGCPVSTTDYGSIHRGVACERVARLEAAAPADDVSTPSHGAREPAWSEAIAIPANLAHVYTECARIWNPIHTDKAVATAAGLPDIILHGTATLALAVSTVLRHVAVERERPLRITGRFGGMVPLPSTVTVTGWTPIGDEGWRRVAFAATTPDGAGAVRDGALAFAEGRVATETST